MAYNRGFKVRGDLEITNYPLITRNQLIEFCKDKDITKELFYEMEMNLVMGANLLDELVAVGETHHPYVQKLLREKKLKRILK